MRQRHLTLAATAAILLSAPLLAACGSTSRKAAAGNIAITAKDDACEVATTTLKPGKTTFSVSNKGSKVTEVYVYAEQNGKYTKMISEVENIGPGVTRELQADLTGGEYEIACKPGQTGDGIRTRITVEGTRSSTDSAGTYDREIEIEATDTALAQAEGLQAKVGEKIEFKLENKGTKKRELVVIDPSGKTVAEVEADAGKTGEIIVQLTATGAWTLKFEGGDKEIDATLTVA